MPLPPSWKHVTVTGGPYLDLTGAPRAGSVGFQLSHRAFVEDDQVYVLPSTVGAALDAAGQFTVDVPASNDPDVTPAFTYRVVESIGREPVRYHDVTIPHDLDTVHLSTLLDSPVPPVPPSEAVNLDARYGRLAVQNTWTKDQTLASSFDGGDDTSDSTSRLNLESYQSSPINAFGEVIRTFLRKAKAKAMHAWYFPTGGYDGNGDPVGTFRPVVWTGAHWRSGDGASLHKHWSIETPDSTGALQTRLEVVFGDQAVDDAIAGLDKTRILTNLADFIVRCSNGQVLRLSTALANEKAIEFANDVEGTVRQWKIRSTAADGDLQAVRYNDAGAFVDALVTLKRGTGRIGVGTTDPSTTFDVNGNKIRVRTALTPASATAPGSQGDLAWDANFLYVCVATNTWKRAAIATW